MDSQLTAAPRPLTSALLFALGDVGPSLMSMCLSFYWLYFLVESAGLLPAHAGLVHGSGYLFSGLASLWAAGILDAKVPRAAQRARLVAGAGVSMAMVFALLWWVVPLDGGKLIWYLIISWLFHLLFSLTYLAYLSLMAFVGSGPHDRVDLNGYRFAGTMLLTLVVLGLHASTEGRWSMDERLLALGAMVAVLGAMGSLLSGLGLAPRMGGTVAGGGGPEGDVNVRWRALGRSRPLWWALGGNLAVWWVVQTTLVVTVFLCASAGVSDALILLILQLGIILAAAGTLLAVRRWSAGVVMTGAAGCWVVGAFLWWGPLWPVPAAALMGMGLGAGSVLSWARVPEALDHLARTTDWGRVDARTYAGLTVLRDLVSAVVPMGVGLLLVGKSVGGPEVGAMASATLLAVAITAAILLRGVERFFSDPPSSSAGRAPMPT